MRKVIGIGETVLDIIFKNDQPMAAVPGGSVFNGIISLGRSGIEASFISETGNDRVGKKIINFLKDNNVNTDNINVVVVPRGFSKQPKLSRSKNNPALLDSEGKLMSREESDKSYESKVNDVLSTSYDKVVQELVQILNSVGYQVTEDGLTNDVVEGEFYSETALTHLLKGIAMFGDDILSTDTFVKDFLRKSAGKLVNKIGNNKI